LIIILKSAPNKKLSVPIPDGWTVESALAVLKEMGHEPKHLEDEAGEVHPIPEEKAA